MGEPSALVRITGIRGSIGNLGGYAQIGTPRFMQLWAGSAWGWDANGNQNCQADLDWLSSGGLGLSFHFTSHQLDYPCEGRACAFANGDEVSLTVATILFVTFYKMEFRFCSRRNSGWKVGLGLGLQGSVWKVLNTRRW